MPDFNINILTPTPLPLNHCHTNTMYIASQMLVWNHKIQSIIILPNILPILVSQFCSFYSWRTMHSFPLRLLTGCHPPFTVLCHFLSLLDTLIVFFNNLFASVLTFSFLHDHENFQIICLLLFTDFWIVRQNNPIIWIAANYLVSRWVFSRLSNTFSSPWFCSLPNFPKMPFLNKTNKFILLIPQLFSSISIR